MAGHYVHERVNCIDEDEWRTAPWNSDSNVHTVLRQRPSIQKNAVQLLFADPCSRRLVIERNLQPRADGLCKKS
jgi:hypothetical protein